ncbi:hypothetical protein CP04DC42_0553 [Chlamydia psittaci 04DC42]|uniref:Uncharacterized protein n=1 Tax=Chlamydia psittaci 99DC5 TaxID=1112251 RepID=A0ABP2X453_CHLPS|nr:hypothetical protein G5O_0151 [Chlamydia psittaci 6BC]AFS20244.1 hypothetical protein B598_0149 [Chlamydia psittaci GR9]AFS21704.1 hypothetical protein B599_0148 [Chlamydia psittaci MN]AFS22325.1 hypothetical protein B600_0155 [Chlamydia psittaci VS225]AFS26564.1 hypothetical protein B711_0154 [Chlamydia psittaci CP3]AFS27673.1 hypothetical protein B712_0147 [Chlamydia psittaci NJ1]ATQ71157.1 uncharacterized protein CHPS25_0137 [Chlamydia psittaci]EGF85347.1 hypothetical protein G5Q_0141 
MADPKVIDLYQLNSFMVFVRIKENCSIGVIGNKVRTAK